MDLLVVAAAHGAVGIDEGGDGENAPDGDEGLFLDSADNLMECLFVVEIPKEGGCVSWVIPVFFGGSDSGGETHSLLSNDDGKGRSAMVIGVLACYIGDMSGRDRGRGGPGEVTGRGRFGFLNGLESDDASIFWRSVAYGNVTSARVHGAASMLGDDNGDKGGGTGVSL